MFSESQATTSPATDFSSLAMALDQITFALDELQSLVEDISEPVLFEEQKNRVAAVEKQKVDDQLEEWLEMAEEEHLLTLIPRMPDSAEPEAEIEHILVRSSQASVSGEQSGN